MSSDPPDVIVVYVRNMEGHLWILDMPPNATVGLLKEATSHEATSHEATSHEATSHEAQLDMVSSDHSDGLDDATLLSSLPPSTAVCPIWMVVQSERNTWTEPLNRGETLFVQQDMGQRRTVLGLAGALRTNPTVTDLKLQSCRMGDDGATVLADALCVNTRLTTLDLSHNDIGDVGVAALATALRHNSSLTRLMLSNNDMGNEGAMALASALRVNTGLKHVGLVGNWAMGDAGQAALTDAFDVNTTLTRLVMSSTVLRRG